MVKEQVSDKVFGLTAVEIYKMVLSGGIKRFPSGYWKLPEAEKNSVEVIRYLFEAVLKWLDNDIKNKLSNGTFDANKLQGMNTIVYGRIPFKSLDAAYPGKFKAWELRHGPTGFWNEDIITQATKWLIEEKLKWSRNDITKGLNVRVFFDNGLGSILSRSNGVFGALDLAYPGEFLPWELSNVSPGFWDGNTSKRATRWLIEEKLMWDRADITNKLTKQVFIANGLQGLLDAVYGSSPFKALEDAYPGKFKPWELKVVAKGYWNEKIPLLQ